MAGTESTSKRPRKMVRLPKEYKVEKRPLLRQPIASPYSTSQKVVYVSTRTPFMSAVKRVQKLLAHAEKRQAQSASDVVKNSRRSRYNNNDDDTTDIDRVAALMAEGVKDAKDDVVVKGTGKAITRALELGLWFQQRDEYKVRIETGTVGAIDDIIAPDEGESGTDVVSKEAGEEIPESRIRYASTIQIFVSPS